MAMSKDYEQLVYLERACEAAERNYGIDPNDADNLTRWGGVLLNLAQLLNVAESIDMIEAAISKLEKSLLINPLKHETVWCLGYAHMMHGLMTPDYNRNCIDRAAEFYEEALEKDPDNQKYLNSLELIATAPQLHAEIHKQDVAQQAPGSGSSNSSEKGTKKEKNYDLIFDIG
ncbi:hypothetical protein MKW94_027617, partial [Papaver nudicaule]|nr:hypothetical protein [Papaver nudicaule]